MHDTNGFDRREFLITGAAVTLLPGRGALAESIKRDAKTLSFLALGDWGQGGSANQRAVAAKLGEVAAERGSAFIITTGDNFYPSGVRSTKDAAWVDSFESIYAAPSLQVPWYPVLGNHDHRGNVQAQVAYSVTSQRWRMAARYYAIAVPLPEGGFAHIFFLDTTEIAGGDDWFGWIAPAGRAREQLEWLEQCLTASNARWKIVVGHHPVHSGGRHGGSSALVRAVKPLMERYGVTLYLNGHDHCLQHVAVNGLHYLTTGAGAKPNGVRRVEGTHFASEELGFLEIELGQSARIRFFSPTRGEIYAHTVSRMPA